MVMKRLMTLAMLLFAVTTFAQVEWGVTGGLNYNMSETGIDKAISETGKIFKGERRSNGWHAGVYTRMYARPDLFFQIGGQYLNGNNTIDVDNVEKTIYNDALQGNLLVGTKIWSFLRFQGGLTGRAALDNSYTDIFGRTQMGYQLGTGVDIGKLTFDISYNGSFSENSGVWNGIPLSRNTSEILLGVGFRF